MRSSWSLLLLSLLPACATSSAIVATETGDRVEVHAVADELAQADVVVLGELHRTPDVHRTHLELIEELHANRDNLVIAMEMFERDARLLLLKYLTGFVDEETFLAGARPWPDYARDYRPVVEFAKEHGLVVLAANAPRKLAAQVAREGLAAVAGNPDVARETSAPEDDYWVAFQEAMQGHPGTTPESMRRMYEAQCLKDDTMAESITDYLAERQKVGDRPLVVLICGRMHSDHGRGTVARIKSRMPQLDVRVLSAEAVDDVDAGIHSAPKSVGDYVVVVPKAPSPRPPEPLDEPAEAAGAAAAKAPAAAPAPAAPAPAEPAADENLRPALGLMPDYAGNEEGVLVGSVREGGSAAKAGIEAGDLIVMLAGEKVTDVETYTELLDAQKIGKTITVRIRRDGAEADLQVVVGSRPRTR